MLPSAPFSRSASDSLHFPTTFNCGFSISPTAFTPARSGESMPETLGHLHYWSVTLTRSADREEVLRAFRASSRILLLRGDAGLGALNTVKEWMQDIGRRAAISTKWRCGKTC